MVTLKSALFFSLLCLTVIWSSLKLGLGTPSDPGPGFFPFISSIVLLILTGIYAYAERNGTKSIAKHNLPVIIVISSLFIYSLVLDYLGFSIATFLLLIVLLLLGIKEKWWLAAVVSLIVTFFSYFLFNKILGVNLPKGLLGL